MRKIECKICKEQFKKEWLLKKHITQKHKEITVARYIVDTEYNGEWPTCKCGCNEELRYFQGKKGFGEYIRGHINKVKGKNNWGNNKKAQIKSTNTRKKRFKSGKIKIWNDGIKQTDNTEYGNILRDATIKMNTKERAKKISKKLKGRKHTKEHIEKCRVAISKAWTLEKKQIQSEKRINWLIKHHKQYTSKLERFFEKDILKKLKIKYEKNFYIKDIKAFYDFKLKNTNILIETDGDFWHCNPNIDNFKIPKYKCQFDNLKRDIQKNEWAQKNGYNLIRFWESDIKNNRLDVIQKLITEIKK